ncbi:MAG TPA: acyl carrier protein [Polyangia bacterium]|nr:acyl carrier protein [Polyangia bacterium]
MSRTAAEVEAIVRDLLASLAPEADLAMLAPDADFRRALDIDSFTFLQFVVGLKERLGIEVPEADYGRVRTLDGCRAYLAAKDALSDAAAEKARKVRAPVGSR